MDLAQEKKTFLNKFKEADSQDSLNSLKIEYLGKKGVLSSLMSQLSNAPAEKKPKLGKSINELKSLIEDGAFLSCQERTCSLFGWSRFHNLPLLGAQTL